MAAIGSPSESSGRTTCGGSTYRASCWTSRSCSAWDWSPWQRFGATLLVQVLAEIGRDLSGAIGADTQGRAIAATAEVLTSTALTFGILVVLYRTVPPVAPPLRALWLPALLATIGFHLATAIYALYLARYGDVTAVYGPLGAVLGFLLVVYVGITVVLLGAELVAAWPEPDRQSGETL